VTKGREPWTLAHRTKDSATTRPALECKKIEYPKHDGKITFDLLDNLTRSGTSHEADQPAHLKLKDPQGDTAVRVSLNKYGGPEERFCPAKVYEYV